MRKIILNNSASHCICLHLYCAASEPSKKQHFYPSHLFEVSGRLNLPNRLHESVPDDDADVGAGVAVCFACKLPKVDLVQTVRRVAQMKSKHLSPSRLLGQRDVDPLLKSDATKRQSSV